MSEGALDITYVPLEGTNYNNLAEAMALIDRNCGKLERKLATLNTQLDVAANQLNLYVTNALFADYNCLEHSALFADDTMSVYMYEDVRRAVIKLHEQDDEFVDEEYSSFFNYFATDDEPQDERATFETLKEYLPEPLFVTPINPRQYASFHDLAQQYDSLFQQRAFVSNKLEASHDGYDEVVKTIITQALEDERYDFNIDQHRMIIIRDKVTCRHSVVYCPLDVADEILGTFDGEVKVDVLDAIAAQIRATRMLQEALCADDEDDLDDVN